MSCAVHSVIFTGLLESEIVRIEAWEQKTAVHVVTGYSRACFSEGLPQIMDLNMPQINKKWIRLEK